MKERRRAWRGLGVGLERVQARARHVRRSLAKTSLAQTYREVVGDGPRPADAVLAALGFAPDLVRMFRDPLDGGSFEFAPTRPGLRLLAESTDQPLRHLRLQLPESPGSVAIGLKLLRELLRATDPAVHFTVLARPSADPRPFRALLRRWGADPDRVRLVRHDVDNLFARDNAQCCLAPDGTPVLLLPRAEAPAGAGDAAAAELACLSGALGLPVLRSRLYWEGGNLLYDGLHGLVGANTIAENACRLGLAEAQVLRALETEFGVPFHVLGDAGEARRKGIALLDAGRPAHAAEGGQADFHIDLDVCPLGAIDGVPTALLADPDLGLAHLPEVLACDALFRDHFLPCADMRRILRADLEATAAYRRPRLAGYARVLEGLGYRVVRQPDLRLAGEHDAFGRINTRFNYCNVLTGSVGEGERVAYLLHYGVPSLDRAASETFSELGVRPVAVAADGVTPNELLRLGGGLHCLCAGLP